MLSHQHRITVKRILVEFSNGDVDFIVEAHNGLDSFVDEFDCNLVSVAPKLRKTARGDFIVDAHESTSLARLNFVGRLTGGARVLRAPIRRVAKRRKRKAK